MKTSQNLNLQQSLQSAKPNDQTQHVRIAQFSHFNRQKIMAFPSLSRTVKKFFRNLLRTQLTF